MFESGRPIMASATCAYSPHPQLLRALQSKYQTLYALRVQGTPSAVPRATFAALAAEFPGALRELDRLPLEAIELRLRALDAVLEGGAPAEPWMQLQIAYHGFMRAVLRIRRALLALRIHHHELEPAQHWLERVAYVAAPGEPVLARFDAAMLRTICRPPQGRLNPWVMEQVALDHAVTVEVVERALLGPRGGQS
jgi:hypothetical protein